MVSNSTLLTPTGGGMDAGKHPKTLRKSKSRAVLASLLHPFQSSPPPATPKPPTPNITASPAASFAVLHDLLALITSNMALLEHSFLAHQPPLHFPALSSPFGAAPISGGAIPSGPSIQTLLSETHLSTHPEARHAVSRIVAACAQLIASVRTPMETLCDVSMAYALPASLSIMESLSVVEILRTAGNGGMHVDEILKTAHSGDSPSKEVENGVSKEEALGPSELARHLRLLATHHVFREVAPDVFANNRISAFMDTGKDPTDITKEDADSLDSKYDDTNGVAAFVGMCTNELFKAAAHLSDSYGLGLGFGPVPVRGGGIGDPNTSFHSQTPISPPPAAPTEGQILRSPFRETNGGRFLASQQSGIASPAHRHDPDRARSLDIVEEPVRSFESISRSDHAVSIASPKYLGLDIGPIDRSTGPPVPDDCGRTAEQNDDRTPTLNGHKPTLSPLATPVLESIEGSVSDDESRDGHTASTIESFGNMITPRQQYTQGDEWVAPPRSSTDLPPSRDWSLTHSDETKSSYTRNSDEVGDPILSAGSTTLAWPSPRNPESFTTGTVENITERRPSLPTELAPPLCLDTDRPKVQATPSPKSTTSPRADPSERSPLTLSPLGIHRPLQALHSPPSRSLSPLSPRPTAKRTAFTVALRTHLPYFSWLEEPEQRNVMKRFGVAMLGSGEWEVGSVVESNPGAETASITSQIGHRRKKGGHTEPEMLNASANLLSAYPWPTLRPGSTIVDIGGGAGFACLKILRSMPAKALFGKDGKDDGITFVIQDRAKVIPDARAMWNREAIKDAVVRRALDEGRVKFVEHNFLRPQPALPWSNPMHAGKQLSQSKSRKKGTTIYLLRAITHDWPDADVLRILGHIRDACSLEGGGDTKLILGDHVVPFACVDDGEAYVFPGEPSGPQGRGTTGRAGFSSSFSTSRSSGFETSHQRNGPFYAQQHHSSSTPSLRKKTSAFFTGSKVSHAPAATLAQLQMRTSYLSVPGSFSQLTDPGKDPREARLLPNLGLASSNAYLVDIVMQSTFASQERTLRHIVALAARAGWSVNAVRREKTGGGIFAYVVCDPC